MQNSRFKVKTNDNFNAIKQIKVIANHDANSAAFSGVTYMSGNLTRPELHLQSYIHIHSKHISKLDHWSKHVQHIYHDTCHSE